MKNLIIAISCLAVIVLVFIAYDIYPNNIPYFWPILITGAIASFVFLLLNQRTIKLAANLKNRLDWYARDMEQADEAYHSLQLAALSVIEGARHWKLKAVQYRDRYARVNLELSKRNNEVFEAKCLYLRTLESYNTEVRKNKFVNEIRVAQLEEIKKLKQDIEDYRTFGNDMEQEKIRLQGENCIVVMQLLHVKDLINELLEATTKQEETEIYQKFAELSKKWEDEKLKTFGDLVDSNIDNILNGTFILEYGQHLEPLTPGGSEFYNDPKRCAEFISEHIKGLKSTIIPQRKEIEELKKEITTLKKEPNLRALIIEYVNSSNEVSHSTYDKMSELVKVWKRQEEIINSFDENVKEPRVITDEEIIVRTAQARIVRAQQQAQESTTKAIDTMQGHA